VLEPSKDDFAPSFGGILDFARGVVKQRSGWGYETLVKEVSDSLHLRRFCGLSLTASLPHESTVRKLARRLGPEVIDEMTRALIEKAIRGKRFTVRAMRVDSTVVESDVRWPSDAALALDATRRLAREGARLAGLVGDGAHHVQDRSRAAGRRLRLIGRTVGRRLGQTGGARAQVLKLTGQAGELVARSIREARKLAAQARALARGRGAQRKLAAALRLEQTAELAAAVTGLEWTPFDGHLRALAAWTRKDAVHAAHETAVSRAVPPGGRGVGPRWPVSQRCC
jgi:hypothetical protein